MGYTVAITCSVCHSNVHVMVGAGLPRPTICDACAQAQADEARAAFLAARTMLSVEERLTLLEAAMYDHQQSTRHPLPKTSNTRAASAARAFLTPDGLCCGRHASRTCT